MVWSSTLIFSTTSPSLIPNHHHRHLKTHLTTTSLANPPSSLPLISTASPLPNHHRHLHSISNHSQTTTTHHWLSTRCGSALRESPTVQFWIALMAMMGTPFSCCATETIAPTEQIISDKINLESLVVSIDGFLNRNPFFVAGVTFVWLVVIPLTEEYLKKYKFIPAVDAFRKLRDNPSCELLDIRDEKSLAYLPSPKLKILNKSVFQLQFVQGDEEEFVNKVLENFKDPANTTLCILDSFDGKSMEVAELLFKNGFKEAYAIKGGLRGKDGWQEIQETLLPPSTHVFPNKNSKEMMQPDMTEEDLDMESNSENSLSSTSSATVRTEGADNGSVNPRSQVNLRTKRQSSPYPNYSDMKPPSSPTPSKPGT